METSDLVRLVAALAFTLALIGLAAFIVQRVRQRLPMMGRGGATSRLSIVEWKPLDGRSQLFLVRRDDVEHLVIVTPQQTPVVVEAGIRRGAPPVPADPNQPSPLPLGPAASVHGPIVPRS